MIKHQDSKCQHVMLTGGGTGLGLALARYMFYHTKHKMILTAREHHIPALLKEFGDSPRAFIRALDVTNEKQRSQIIHEAIMRWKRIDVLINNAAVCYRSVVEHMDDESEGHQIGTNYLGPMALIRLVVPVMREQGYGKIMNISSVSGMLGMPTMASYSASKHALEGASESLWYELKPFGIRVSVIQPGFISSDSFMSVKQSKKAQLSSLLDGPYNNYYNLMRPFIARMMKLSRHAPVDIAKLIVRNIEKESPPLWISATYDAWVFLMLRRFVPRNLFHKLMFMFLPGSSSWGDRYSKVSKIVRKRSRKLLPTHN